MGLTCHQVARWYPQAMVPHPRALLFPVRHLAMAVLCLVFLGSLCCCSGVDTTPSQVWAVCTWRPWANALVAGEAEGQPPRNGWDENSGYRIPHWSGCPSWLFTWHTIPALIYTMYLLAVLFHQFSSSVFLHYCLAKPPSIFHDSNKIPISGHVSVWEKGKTRFMVTVSKESTCNTGDCPQCMRPGFDPWVRKIPWSRKW